MRSPMMAPPVRALERGRPQPDLRPPRGSGAGCGHSARIVQEPRATVTPMKEVPGADWATRAPAEVGLAADGLAVAAKYHRARESTWPRDFITSSGRYIGVEDEPMDSEVLGPVRSRGGPNGVVVRHGHLAAEWGNTSRADMTFSVAKGYLAVLAGIAVDRGLIRQLDDPVRRYALDD